MTTPQAKIRSGFGHGTTAMEVIKGIDLTGKTALVTGGYSGIGTETVKALISAGARVIVAGRRPEEANASLGGLGVTIDLVKLDLGDPDQFGPLSGSRRHRHDEGACRWRLPPCL